MPATSSAAPVTEQSAADQEITALLKKNIEWSEALYKQNVRIQKHLRWMSLFSTLRLLLILIPIVLGIIYLPPILADVWQEYRAVLGIGSGGEAHNLEVLLEHFSNN